LSYDPHKCGIDDEEAAQNGSAAAISRQPSGPDAGRRRTDTMLATSGVGFGGAFSGQNVAAGRTSPRADCGRSAHQHRWRAFSMRPARSETT